jgi:hypothetical protein
MPIFDFPRMFERSTVRPQRKTLHGRIDIQEFGYEHGLVAHISWSCGAIAVLRPRTLESTAYVERFA